MKTEIPNEMTLVGFVQSKTKDIEKLYVLAHLHHTVEIGLCEKGEMQLECLNDINSELLQDIRLFGPHDELYIWREGAAFYYRMIAAEEKAPENVHEETHYMWGDEINENGQLEEKNRGMQLTAPFSLQKEQRPLKYTVRNYYNFDADGLMCFYDARLVEICGKSDKIL